MGVLLLLLTCLFGAAASNADDRLLLSDQLVGREFTYIVQPGDSLTAIGARFGVGVNLLAAGNKLAHNARLKIAQELNIDNRHIVPRATDDGIVINIPQRMLYLFKEGQALRNYPVALGKPDWPTPSGRFRIAVKEENPVWDVPKSIQEEMRREGKVKTCVPVLIIAGATLVGLASWLRYLAIANRAFIVQTNGCIRLHRTMSRRTRRRSRHAGVTDLSPALGRAHRRPGLPGSPSRYLRQSAEHRGGAQATGRE
jgi:L,D-transpeptidase ErfK/SrfK